MFGRGWGSREKADFKELRELFNMHIKKQRHYFAKKGFSSQSYGFSSSHVWMWEVDHKESTAPKNWCFWTVVLEKTLESSLDCKEIQPVHSKGNQSEYSLEGLMLKLKLQYFGHLMQRTDSLEKILILGKIEGGIKEWQRMKWLDGITDSMDWVWVSSGVGDGQGSLACLQSMGLQIVGHDWSIELNWSKNEWKWWNYFWSDGIIHHIHGTN